MCVAFYPTKVNERRYLKYFFANEFVIWSNITAAAAALLLLLLLLSMFVTGTTTRLARSQKV